jgi:phage-related minor tail protein
MKDEGAALFEQTRTPLEQYQEGMKHLDELLKSGAIDQDTYARAAKQLGEQFSETAPAVNELTDTFEQLGQSIEYSLSNALAGLASGAMSAKDAFTEMAQSMSQQLAQLAAQLLTSQIFKLLSMIGGSLSPIQGGGFLSSLLGSLAGPRAAGGPVAAGSSYLVGENGPELFRPNTSGSIVPNNALRGGSSQMNVTVINNSASSVSTRKNQRGDLEVMIEDMLADKLARGGNKVDSALQRGYGLKRAGR